MQNRIRVSSTSLSAFHIRLIPAPETCDFTPARSSMPGRLLDLWAYHHQARIDFSRPGKPTDNCYVETFNGSFRDECLNLHWFDTVEEASVIIEAWRQDYNESRPHMALGDVSPFEFARQLGAHAQLTGISGAEN